ncbi:unnamed protein product [Gongylonema pulchrum]|uniref:FHA domain-containing protein n=1 Tax=Gongylonema pulchrum TaxID=637853 RepID=A0A183DEA9_9BILA|nr:unnamed protein product [Gongylonema pulchrum]
MSFGAATVAFHARHMNSAIWYENCPRIWLQRKLLLFISEKFLDIKDVCGTHISEVTRLTSHSVPGPELVLADSRLSVNCGRDFRLLFRNGNKISLKAAPEPPEPDAVPPLEPAAVPPLELEVAPPLEPAAVPPLELVSLEPDFGGITSSVSTQNPSPTRSKHSIPNGQGFSSLQGTAIVSKI